MSHQKHKVRLDSSETFLQLVSALENQMKHWLFTFFHHEEICDSTTMRSFPVTKVKYPVYNGNWFMLSSIDEKINSLTIHKMFLVQLDILGKSFVTVTL